MTEQQGQQFQLSSEQPAADANYRAISRPAITALLLSLISPVALMLTVLFIIPILAVIVAIYALWTIRGSDRPLIGRGAAIAALFVGLVVFAIPVSSEFTYNWVVCHRARRHADTWLGLIQNGQLRPAHQFAIYPAIRAADDVASLDILYDNDDDLQQQLQEYFAQKLISTIVDYGHIGTVNFVKQLGHRPKGEGDLISLQYEMTYEVDGEKNVIDFKVLLHRSLENQSDVGSWQLQAIEELSEA